MPLSPNQISALKDSRAPAANYGGYGVPDLFLSWEPSPNPLSSTPHPCYIIKDWAGWLCSTSDLGVVGELAKLEATGGQGTVRALLTGEIHLSDPALTPKQPTFDGSLTLGDLDLEL